MELFRLALQERNSEAWEIIYEQYSPQVRKWVLSHPSFARCDEEIDKVVNRAFERMWRAVTPDKFNQFADLAQLLSYLQRCVDGALRDYKQPPPYVYGLTPDLPSRELTLDEHVQRKRLWEAVYAHVRTPQEEVILHAYFFAGMKPRQLCTRYPRLFPTPKDVNRVRTGFVARLKRNLGEPML